MLTLTKLEILLEYKLICIFQINLGSYVPLTLIKNLIADQQNFRAKYLSNDEENWTTNGSISY